MTTETVNTILGEVDQLPRSIRSWQIETGPDVSGTDAVWVWVTLDDDAFNGETTSRVRNMIRQAVQSRGGENAPWVYVRFRGASEVVPH